MNDRSDKDGAPRALRALRTGRQVGVRLTVLLELAAALALGLMACGSAAGEDLDAGRGGTGGAAGPGMGGAGGSAGIGGAAGADAGADPAARFVGTWSVVSGTITLSCANGYNSTSAVSSPDVFVRGIGFDLVLQGLCPTTFAISGTTATATPPGQHCYDASSNLNTTLTAQTFTTSDGLIGYEAASGQVSGLWDPATMQTIGCTVSESATYQKIAN